MSCPLTSPAPFGVRFSAVRACVALLFLVAASVAANAQSQALNGQIEGTITDPSGAALPAVTVTLVNVDNGTERVVTSDDDGTYRAPLLPLGTYRITAEVANFKRLIREGITLTTGQTATVDLSLETGGVEETVTISGDAPIADAARIDLGRTINEREIRNLPLVTRNPYNFGLLQANVTGRPNSEFGVPVINANGYARRANYQLDGNNNTQTDRAGIRLMPISELFVSEVQLVTNGFSAEFGNTPGIIFNTVTPAGTNDYHGSVSYRFRRTAFSSRPFFLNPFAPKPGTKVDNFAGAVGGPIIRDRWQFYTGYERVNRDLSGQSQRVVPISDANRQRLIAAGVSQSAFVGSIPTKQSVDFFIVRSDVQINDANRLVGRYNLFRNTSPDNIAGTAGGVPNLLERSVDFIDAADSVGVQLISTISPRVLNEARYQYAKRDSRFLANANSGTGPSILIQGIALFGAPEDDDTISPIESNNQILDNVTFTFGEHTAKFGAGINSIKNRRRSNVFARYEFPSIAAFEAARSGANPRSYTRFVESSGDPNIEYDAQFYQFFAQDDWKITPRLKVNYGLRYDLYVTPDADRSAALPFSQEFRTDRNNFAPRLGIVYGLREGTRPTVLRASAGVYYEPPFLDIYRRAIISNGNPRFLNFDLTPAQAAAPAFPGTLGSAPTVPRQSIDAVSPDYANLTAYHANLQAEQAVTSDLSVTLGYIFSRGTHLPVYRNINPINPISTLADGRPVFSTAINASTRLFPQFNNVLLVESVGNSDYNAGTLSVNKRFATGYQFSLNYTYSHAIDDAPEQNLVNATGFVLSDPTNRRRDRGNSLADQRHTFSGSFVGRPTFDIENRFLRRLVNDNQVGFIVIANSGEVFNITAAGDPNADGITGSDRPLFVGRNTGNTPAQFNVDLRYSRFITFSERFRAEVFGEFTNLFNRNNIIGVNSAGLALTAPPATFPDFFTRNPSALDSRQFQLGFKFNF